jgi:hypothetical protein
MYLELSGNKPVAAGTGAEAFATAAGLERGPETASEERTSGFQQQKEQQHQAGEVPVAPRDLRCGGGWVLEAALEAGIDDVRPETAHLLPRIR